MSKDQGLLSQIPPLSEDPEDSLSLIFQPIPISCVSPVSRCYLETPSTWDPWWPHLAWPWVDNSHSHPSRLTLSPASTCSEASLLLFQPHSLETPPLGMEPRSPSSLSGSLQSTFFVLLQPNFSCPLLLFTCISLGTSSFSVNKIP